MPWTIVESPGSVSTMSAAARAASVEPFKSAGKGLKKGDKSEKRCRNKKNARNICRFSKIKNRYCLPSGNVTLPVQPPRHQLSSMQVRH